MRLVASRYGFSMWLLWIIGIFLVIRLVFKLYGHQIARLAQRRVIKMMEKEMRKQSDQFQRNYGNDRQESVYVDEDIKVSQPRHDGSRDVSEDDIAEDVEFEEIKRS